MDDADEIATLILSLSRVGCGRLIVARLSVADEVHLTSDCPAISNIESHCTCEMDIILGRMYDLREE